MHPYKMTISSYFIIKYNIFHETLPAMKLNFNCDLPE